MTTEPVHQEIADDDQAPATKGDIRSLRTEVEGIDQRLISVEADMRVLKSDVAALKDTTARVLNVVESIDQRLKEWKDIPERVSKLEDNVLKLTLRR